MSGLRALAIAVASVLIAASALGQEFKAGDLVIEQLWTRTTPKGADVAAGYMVLRNDGAQADRLLGGTAEFAASVEIQQMVSADGVMRMRPVTGGVEIPPRGTVTFKPNGYHLIFHGLKQQLEAGQTLKATLKFERAGAAPVELKVDGVGPI